MPTWIPIPRLSPLRIEPESREDQPGGCEVSAWTLRGAGGDHQSLGRSETTRVRASQSCRARFSTLNAQITNPRPKVIWVTHSAQ